MTLQALGIGSLFVDTISTVDEAFLIENKFVKGAVTPSERDTMDELIKSAGNSQNAPGGSCANVLRSLSQLGWKCHMTGKVGSDFLGDYLLKDLDNRGIDPLIERVSDLPTGRVFCMVTDDGERTMVYDFGASSKVSSRDLKSDYFQGKKLVHIEGYALDYGNLVEEATKHAKAAKALVSFDLSNFFYVKKYSERIKNLLATSIDIVFGNEQEAQELTGLSAREAAKAISDLCPLAIITMGEKGCWVCKRGEEPQQFPAKKVTQVVDTTGAGDAFTAAFLNLYLRGKPLEDCTEAGAEWASRVIQIKGAVIEM